ncbi:MAG: glycosyltransferase [Acidobacteria bacterium]|nr:glycosyltransferase [Acidobacteriota bacterium]
MSNLQIRVLQIIDSLSVGGAEKMAVSFANELVERVGFSGICVTRSDGPLRRQIQPNVACLFLQKKSVFDLRALTRLVAFMRKNQINVLHAHSSSIYTAVLARMLYPCRVVWHDHYGNAEMLSERPTLPLKWVSRWIDYIWSVTPGLWSWSLQTLKRKENSGQYLPNFPQEPPSTSALSLQFQGNPLKRIVCLANLRPQKDHLTLIRAFSDVLKVEPDAHLFLIGRDFEDAYSTQVRRAAESYPNIHIVGVHPNPQEILPAFRIGVLSSRSEGLPLALLEYGMAQLAPVCTSVGHVSAVIPNPDYLVPVEDPARLAERVTFLLKNPEACAVWAQEFHHFIQNHYSRNACLLTVVQKYATWFPAVSN